MIWTYVSLNLFILELLVRISVTVTMPKGKIIMLKKDLSQEKIDEMRKFYLELPERSRADVRKHFGYPHSIVDHFC